MNKLIERYNDLVAREKVLISDVNTISNTISINEVRVVRLSKARWIIAEVQKLTQEKFKKKVEDLITLAIRSVFEDRDFRFILELERKRNKLECSPKIFEGEDEYDDMEGDFGGGLIDIISFAFRLVLWSLENPRSRNVFILDEPMKHIGKGELLFKAANIFKKISKELNIQLIIVTHEKAIAEIADRIFEVSHNGVYSEVETIYVKPIKRELEKIKLDKNIKEKDMFPNIIKKRKKL